jgi:hypothetical protein
VRSCRPLARFHITPRLTAKDDEPWLWMCATVRHWNLDRDDPR